MSQAFTHIVDLAKEVEPPADGILTRTLFNNEDVKAVIFGFGQGEELSEHTASMPASLHFLKGEATLTLGDETVEAQHRLGQFPHRCCFRARGHLQASGSVHVHESFEHIKNVLGGHATRVEAQRPDEDSSRHVAAYVEEVANAPQTESSARNS
jgi:hypothetical protein